MPNKVGALGVSGSEDVSALLSTATVSGCLVEEACSELSDVLLDGLMNHR